MQLAFEDQGDVGIVRVRETKLTYPVLSSFFAEVRQLVEGGRSKLVIDLAQVTYIDSASIGCLMDIHRLVQDKDGALSRAEAGKDFEGFFDSMDANRDGKITRDEYEAVLRFMSEGVNSAFAVKAGGAGDVTKSHVLWRQTKGLPYVPSAIVYRG